MGPVILLGVFAMKLQTCAIHHVCPSARMLQLNNHSIWFKSLTKKSDTFQYWLKSDSNNGYFT
jgi:hypothetical protein